MKKSLLIVSTLLSVSSSWASIVYDDFNRSDSGMNSSGSIVGADWESSRTTGQWGVVDQQLAASMTEANSILYHTALETLSGNGTNFTANLDVKALASNAWAGLAFNYQNPTNFYYFRYKSGASNYALARMVDGSAVNLINLTIAGTFATNTDYTLTVASANAYGFTYKIQDTNGTVLAAGSATDSESSFTGGYAGILQSATGADRHRFDNFSVVTEPSTGALNFNLFILDSELPALSNRVASVEFSSEWARFVARADRLCDTNSVDYADPDNVTADYTNKVHTVPRRLIHWMQTLGMVYRLTGDVKYRDHGIDLLLNSAQILTLDSVYMAEAVTKVGAKGDLMRGLATGYDFFAGDLTGLQRVQVLLREQEYVEDFIVNAQNPLTSWRPYHNYTGVCGGAAGLVALQLRDLDPSAANGFLQQTLVIIEDWLDQGFDDQGAYYEGVLYSVYGLETVVFLADVLKRNGGADLFTNSTLQNVSNYYIQSALPGEKNLDARNDSLYQNPGEILLKLATEYNNGVAKWLYETRLDVDRYNTWSPGRSFFLQLLWTSDLVEVTPDVAGMVLEEYFQGRGLCTWRTGWQTDDVMFSVEAGKYYLVTHDQADEGHFTLYGYGYKWACDPGYANNNDIGGRAQTMAHNCVLIDGQGQARSGAGIGNSGSIISYTNTSDYGYSLSDCSDAYRWYYKFNAEDRLVNPDGLVITNTALFPLDHAYRHTVFVRETDTEPAYAIVLDDIAKDETLHDYQWQMLSWPGLEIAISNTTVVIAPEGGSAAEKMFVFLDAESPLTLGQDVYTPSPVDGITPGSFPRLKATCNAANPYFSAVLVPTDAGRAPIVTFENTLTEKIIYVEWPGKTDRITWQKSSTNNAVQLLSTSCVLPLSVTDDFNRPDSGMNSTGATVGSDWHSSRTTGQWGIVDQRVVASMIEANSVLYNSVLETISGNGTHFAASLDVKAFGAYWAGLVFNYQNSTNFYYLRYKGTASDYQMYRMVDGTSVKLFGATIGGTFATNTDYTLAVVSSNAYEFAYEIKATGGAVLASGTATDNASSFSGGYAGILQTSTGADRNSFDNFSLTVGSSVIPGYAGWATGWGVDIGAETNDYDLDGLLNLYEYGLGGDPTDPANQGEFPEFGIVDSGGTTVFRYVYPQRSDPDSGLSYSLALRTNLMFGGWATNAGYEVSGTNATGGMLDFVTNVIDTVEDQIFIRLIIE